METLEAEKKTLTEESAAKDATIADLQKQLAETQTASVAATPATAAEPVEKTASAKGFVSDVKVTVTLDAEGKITAIKVDASNETPGYGQRTMDDEDFLAQFIGKTLPLTLGEGVDALSGATYTSTAIVEALNSLAD